MLRLTKKIEYAILAMQYIASNPNKLISAKEISEKLNISFEFLSKTLQTLMKFGLISSHQGKSGGYTLAKEPTDISISEIINALDENQSVVECAADADSLTCGRQSDCTIKKPMNNIQNKINSIFEETTLAEFSIPIY